MLSKYIPKKALMQAINEKISEKDIKIINYLIYLSNKFHQLYPSYKQIASYVGCCERTIQRRMKYLESLGLIKSTFRLMTSSIYTVHHLIYQYGVVLRTTFQALNQSPRIWLFGAFITAFGRNVLPIEDIFYKSNLSNSVGLTDARARVTHRKNPRDRYLKNRNGEKMDESLLVISPTLRDITNQLHLTKVGQIKLMAFPDKVLVHAWTQSRLIILSAKDPYKYLYSVCLNYAQSCNLEVNTGVVSILMRKFNLDMYGKEIRPLKQGVEIKSNPVLKKPVVEDIRDEDDEEKRRQLMNQWRIDNGFSVDPVKTPQKTEEEKISPQQYYLKIYQDLLKTAHPRTSVEDVIPLQIQYSYEDRLQRYIAAVQRYGESLKPELDIKLRAFYQL